MTSEDYMKNLILASKSPRRKEILSMLNIPFDVVAFEIDESFEDELSIYENIENIAYKKAKKVYDLYKHTSYGVDDKIIISADTVVYLDKEVMLKPKSKVEARNMLLKLKNNTHSVISSICIMDSQKTKKKTLETKVTFNDMTNEEIEEYISTKEPYDKAGAYAVQGLAAKFIKKIDGDYFNVVGMSISCLYDMLKEFK